MKTILPPQGPPPPKVYQLECLNQNCRAKLLVREDELIKKSVSYKKNIELILICPYCEHETSYDDCGMDLFLDDGTLPLGEKS